MTKEEIEEVLQECKKRFPKGVEIASAYSGSKMISKGDCYFEKQSGKYHNIVWNGTNDMNRSGWLYWNGKYATVYTEEPEYQVF